jgi:hypothetical protein
MMTWRAPRRRRVESLDPYSGTQGAKEMDVWKEGMREEVREETMRRIGAAVTRGGGEWPWWDE